MKKISSLLLGTATLLSPIAFVSSCNETQVKNHLNNDEFTDKPEISSGENGQPSFEEQEFNFTICHEEGHGFFQNWGDRLAIGICSHDVNLTKDPRFDRSKLKIMLRNEYFNTYEEIELREKTYGGVFLNVLSFESILKNPNYRPVSLKILYDDKEIETVEVWQRPPTIWCPEVTDVVNKKVLRVEVKGNFFLSNKDFFEFKISEEEIGYTEDYQKDAHKFKDITNEIRVVKMTNTYALFEYNYNNDNGDYKTVRVSNKNGGEIEQSHKKKVITEL